MSAFGKVIYTTSRGATIIAAQQGVIYEIPIHYEAGSLRKIRLLMPHSLLTAAGNHPPPAVLEIRPVVDSSGALQQTLVASVSSLG